MKYTVTEEIADLFVEARAYADLRNLAIDSFWNSKKAIQYSKKSIECYDKAWFLVKELYPDLEKKTNYLFERYKRSDN